ncbi:MAG: hypothetical protein ACF8SC_08920 [Phycisphaerales bacterium JB037]
MSSPEASHDLLSLEGGDLVVRHGGRVVFASPIDRVTGVEVRVPSVWTHPVATIWYGAMAILPMSIAGLVLINTPRWFPKTPEWIPFVVTLAAMFVLFGVAGWLLLRMIARELREDRRRLVVLAGDRRFGFDFPREEESAVRARIERLRA